MKRSREESQPDPRDSENTPWRLQLFVTRESAASAVAIIQLKRIVSEYLPENSSVEIIDIYDEPETAEAEQILAIPTLVRKYPTPVRRVIGDLSSISKVLTSIGFATSELELSAND